MLEKQIEEILEKDSGERKVSNFLAKNPQVIRWAVCRTGGHSAYVLKEFPFGSNYKADFVVLTSYSGAWEINLIELEPPDDKVITKAGLPSNKLNTALSQIKDWKGYIENFKTQFQTSITDWCMKKDLLKQTNYKGVPTNDTGDFLNLPTTFIYYNYYIFIGNRKNINPDKRRKMNQFRNEATIFTYGRILDIAKNFDQFDSNPEISIQINKSEE
jgi:hypothetical protein